MEKQWANFFRGQSSSRHLQTPGSSLLLPFFPILPNWSSPWYPQSPFLPLVPQPYTDSLPPQGSPRALGVLLTGPPCSLHSALRSWKGGSYSLTLCVQSLLGMRRAVCIWTVAKSRRIFENACNIAQPACSTPPMPHPQLYITSPSPSGLCDTGLQS